MKKATTYDFTDDAGGILLLTSQRQAIQPWGSPCSARLIDIFCLYTNLLHA